ncbi:hypothetical protein [uncultured Muriicola sp.]|uniref:hypothetical protein n=1 Tax=uncultured Muriicola sp. TaxID=1583102 RepID=UPI002633C394|nr:hypothetical protein [uncultured Muriicola sp.]
MKRSITLLLILITCLPWGLRAQEEKGGESVISFYRSMAIEDALLEQSLNFALEEDEMDYWKDQRNFENNLKQENYTAYKTYIFFKSRSYLEHKQGCDIATKHGKGYKKQASFYATHAQRSLSDKDIAAKDLIVSPSLVSQRH